MNKIDIKTIDEYISQFPINVRGVLQKVRETIKKAAPNAIETISYQMPTFKLNGRNLVHFAAWKDHIGFYPMPTATKKFEKVISKYSYSKGSIRFPINQPIPFNLISKIVKYRLKEEK